MADLHDVGELRHRVTIQQNTRVQDSTGQEIKKWSDVKTVWADIDDQLTGTREEDEASLVMAQTMTRISFRDGGDDFSVDETMRIKHRDEIYSIEGINRGPTRKRFITCICLKENE